MQDKIADHVRALSHCLDRMKLDGLHGSRLELHATPLRMPKEEVASRKIASNFPHD